MVKLSLSRHAHDSLSDQIYQQLGDRIRSNILKNGEKLPSIRTFSKAEGVSHLTVQKAYKKLEKDGLVESIQGKGVFVKSKRIEESPSGAFDWQLSIPTYLIRSSFNSRVKTKYPFDFSTLDSGLLPTKYLAEQIKQMLDDESSIIGTYGDIPGDYLTRKSFCDYFQNHLNLLANIDDVIITPGLHQGIDLIARALIRTGDVVVTEEPTYPGALDIFINYGAKIISIPMDEEGMRIDLLSKAAKTYHPKLIYVNPTFQNPTGCSISSKRRKEILQQAQLHGMLIVEDDSWSEIYFEDTIPPKPIKALDDEGRVIFLKAFSKAYAPGIRIGAILVNGPLREILLTSKATTDMGTPLLIQRAVLPFLNSKRMYDHIEKIRLALELRRDKVISLLKDSFDSTISWTEPKGGLNIWLTFPEEVSTIDLYYDCIKEDLSFLPGHVCYPYDPPNNHLRLCYSILNERELEEGIKKFIIITKRFLKERMIHS